MNRKKKLIQKLKKREKRANAKLSSKTKPKYISKADRTELAAEPRSLESKKEQPENKSPAIESPIPEPPIKESLIKGKQT